MIIQKNFDFSIYLIILIKKKKNFNLFYLKNLIHK
jgi:hypothetical protein